MKSLKTQIIYFISFILFGIFSSCEDPNEPDYRSFLIKVDSIQVPDNIAVNEPFELKLYGTIGHSGCSQFSQFKTEEQGNDIMIEAWGKINKKSRICAGVEVCLDDEKLNYVIRKKGNYTIKIKQPDKNYLEQQISVK
jgi:hypothetical protein